MKNSNQSETPCCQGGGIDYSVCHKTLLTYTVATGCPVQMFDESFRLLESAGDSKIEQGICPHCAAFAKGPASGSLSVRGTACYEMHLNAVRESGNLGRPYIYQCALGFKFWACPVYSENKFFGVLRGSGYLDSKADIQVFEAGCNGTITPEDFSRRVSVFPVCGDEKIISLAEMLLL